MLKWCTNCMYCNTQASVTCLHCVPSLSLTLTHSHTLTATHARSLSCWKVECRLEVLLIGCEAAVASPVYTGLERGQHQPHVVCMAPSFGICQRGERILKHIHAWTNTATHTHRYTRPGEGCKWHKRTEFVDRTRNTEAWGRHTHRHTQKPR